VLTEEVRVEAARRYIQAYEIVTGLPFKPIDGPIQERVRRALAKLA
jgi:hypothetical protein